MFYLTVEITQAKCLNLQAFVGRAIINMKWNCLGHPNRGTDEFDVCLSVHRSVSVEKKTN